MESNVQNSGGSRIFQTRLGAPTPEFGAETYYFSRVLHENERNWTEKKMHENERNQLLNCD